MAIPGSAGPFLLAQLEEEGGYEIERSVRFNSADSAYLSRTPGSASNRKTWTWVGWVKRSELGNQTIFEASPGGDFYTLFWFTSSDQIQLLGDEGAGPVTIGETSAAVFRDVSAWMHVLLAVDTSQASASSRVRLYINGIEATLTKSLSPSLNYDTYVNSANAHAIAGGARAGMPYFSGYLADIHFIDGQALDPSSFGEFDTNGVWQPIDASGLTYGTNGFHLDFSDNSSNAALGTDISGNSNTWTVNNIIAAPTTVDYTGTSTYDVQGDQGDEDPSGRFRIFDGSLSTYWQYYATVDRTDPYKPTIVTLAPGISYSSSVRVYWLGYPVANRYVTMNGGSYTSVGTDAGWITLATGSGTLNSITTLYTNSGGTQSGYGQAFVSAIEVDGVILTDPQPWNTDSLVDSPVNGSQEDTGVGGEVVGNYATLNPLSSGTRALLSDGNLKVTGASGAGYNTALGTVGMSSGKWYWEQTLTSIDSADLNCGIANTSFDTTMLGADANGYGVSANNLKWNNGSSAYTTGFVNGDIVGMAFDADAGTLTFYRNGSSLGTAFTGIPAGTYFAGAGVYSPTTVSILNFGQRPFAYTAPSGFKVLCTTNLPEPTIADGSTAMDVVTYTGNGSARSITLPGGFSPDLIWTKSRSSTLFHHLYDSVRGTNSNLNSNSTSGELTGAPYNDGVTAFGSNGYSLGAFNGLNENTTTYVAWSWDAGSSTVTNTQGSITSQVRANASAGFSVVTYTGTGCQCNCGHGLGVAPSCYIVKAEERLELAVYHKYWRKLLPSVKPTECKAGPDSVFGMVQIQLLPYLVLVT
jgi:hypothetical protein